LPVAAEAVVHTQAVVEVLEVIEKLHHSPLLREPYTRSPLALVVLVAVQLARELSDKTLFSEQ
jgi:hypothetical protein